jgi:hypothetical protein
MAAADVMMVDNIFRFDTGPMDIEEPKIVFEFEKMFDDEPKEPDSVADEGNEHNPDATGSKLLIYM